MMLQLCLGENCFQTGVTPSRKPLWAHPLKDILYPMTNWPGIRKGPTPLSQGGSVLQHSSCSRVPCGVALWASLQLRPHPCLLPYSALSCLPSSPASELNLYMQWEPQEPNLRHQVCTLPSNAILLLIITNSSELLLYSDSLGRASCTLSLRTTKFQCHDTHFHRWKTKAHERWSCVASLTRFPWPLRRNPEGGRCTSLSAKQLFALLHILWSSSTFLLLPLHLLYPSPSENTGQLCGFHYSRSLG